jgi:NAD(P)-dependent dehydrogenase (short-subunit alcohol dehydrogenase family)
MEGKVIAITGGASGIGLATAQTISKRGAIVCIADINEAALKAAAEHFEKEKAEYSIQKLDVSNDKDVDDWIEGIFSKYGRLDGAANVAGITGDVHGMVPLQDVKNEDWDRIIKVNLYGTMYCMRAELRRISKGGSIVNVSSIHGIKGQGLIVPLIRAAKRIHADLVH